MQPAGSETAHDNSPASRDCPMTHAIRRIPPRKHRPANTALCACQASGITWRSTLSGLLATSGLASRLSTTAVASNVKRSTPKRWCHCCRDLFKSPFHVLFLTVKKGRSSAHSQSRWPLNKHLSDLFCHGQSRYCYCVLISRSKPASLQTPMHIHPNLLLWWIFGAILRDCAFF